MITEVPLHMTMTGKSVSHSEYPKVSDELDSDEKDRNSLSAENSDEKKNSPKQLVITIQLVCCIIIALAAFLLNLLAGEVCVRQHGNGTIQTLKNPLFLIRAISKNRFIKPVYCNKR